MGANVALLLTHQKARVDKGATDSTWMMARMIFNIKEERLGRSLTGGGRKPA
jgi:hypothetical protein